MRKFTNPLDRAEKAMDGLTGPAGGHEVGFGDLVHVLFSLYSIGKYSYEMDDEGRSRLNRLQKKNRLLMNYVLNTTVPDETMAAINEESKEGLE